MTIKSTLHGVQGAINDALNAPLGIEQAESITFNFNITLTQ